MKKNVMIGVLAGILLFGMGLAAGVYLVEDEVTMEWWIGEPVEEQDGSSQNTARYTNVDHSNEVTTIASIFIQGEPAEAPADLALEQPDFIFNWNDPSHSVGVLTYYVWFTEEGAVYAIPPYEQSGEWEFKALNQMDADYLRELAEGEES